MKITMFILSAACVLCMSCTSKPDPKDSLYAFETADAARKNWSNPIKENEISPSPDTFHQTDSVKTDSITNHLQNR